MGLVPIKDSGLDANDIPESAVTLNKAVCKAPSTARTSETCSSSKTVKPNDVETPAVHNLHTPNLTSRKLFETFEESPIDG